MDGTWIAITVTAALCQTWRTALQQRLRKVLSVGGASFTRYVYAIPVGTVLLCGCLAATGEIPPPPNARFLAFCVAGGLMQMVGTALLIMSFGFRSFAVGSAYAKTEGIQTALVGWLVLGEHLPPIAWAGIGLGLAGVMTLSLAGPVRGGRAVSAGELLRATVQPAALCGLGAGFSFALTSALIKQANQALGGPHVILQSLLVLVATNVLQTMMQGGWMLLREPREIASAFRHWRSGMWVGALSGLGSAAWFSAFALAPIGMVRSLGQIEMPLIILFGRFYLKEPQRPADMIGLALVMSGVSLVLLGIFL